MPWRDGALAGQLPAALDKARKVYGYAGMEKMMAATLFEYAGLNK